jgi:hypothetical protein
MHWVSSRFFMTRFVPLSRGNERNERWSGHGNRRNEKKRVTETALPISQFKRFGRFLFLSASLAPHQPM